MTELAGARVAQPVDGHGSLEDVKDVRDVKASTNQGIEALKDITFGSVSSFLGFTARPPTFLWLTAYLCQTAGIIGKVIEYPFDTVKVRLQSQPFNRPHLYNGPLDCFRQSIHNDGISGLYRGISAPLLGAAIETSSLFFSYRLAQDALQATILPPSDGAPLPLKALVLCGAASGAFTSLLLTPIELIKCKMQVPIAPSSMQAPGPLSLISTIYRHQGIMGFWHGQLGTLIRETGGSAAWFGIYEGATTLFRRFRSPVSASTSVPPPLPVWQQMLAGAAAGVSYNFVFFPADTIKSRMQTEDVSTLAGGHKRTFWTVGEALWRQQGLRGLYRGCGITVFRAAPSSAFIFAVYEALRGWFG